MNTMKYAGNLGPALTNRAPSPAIWKDCPWRDIAEGVRNGVIFYDDFQDFPLIGTQTTEIGHGKYKVFATTGSSVSRVSAVNSVELAGGALRLATDTDNDSATIAQSYPTYLMSGLKTNSGKLWFECCFARKSLLTNMAAGFIGFAEVEQWTLATGVPFNGGDAITNAASAIGFRLEEDGLGVIDTVYSDRATSFTNIGDAESTLTAAFAFIKLGMRYDPADVDGKAVRFFANNVELPTALSTSALVALTNLDANALGLIWSMCADSAGTAAEDYLKWWRVAQVFDLDGGAFP